MKLLVHIGAGKTGSSSIQAALDSYAATATEQPVSYLGIMLEHSKAPNKFSWQFQGGSDEFFLRLDSQIASNQLYTALHDALTAPSASHVDTFVWSNEWLFDFYERALPALLRLKDDGHDIEIICYIRRHDKWLQSAYLQWGLKHKTYTGPIKNFNDWKQGRNLQFYPSVEAWKTPFEAKIHLFNFDVLKNVTAHFFEFLGLDYTPAKRANVSPSNVILAAWTVFNNRFQGQVPAPRFQEVMRPSRERNKTKHPLPPISSLLPSNADLTETVAEHDIDIQQINEILAAQSQPPLSFKNMSKKNEDPTSWEMDQFILNYIFSLQEQVFNLQARIEKMQKEDKS